MTKWYSEKQVPNYHEWIVTEWYDEEIQSKETSLFRP